MEKDSEQYLFGDSDLAARRLKLVARVFAGTMTSFLQETVTHAPGLVVDLGCGPGHTTHHLADTLRCDSVVGLDNSEHFIGLARDTATDTVSFHLHDITTLPFPTGPCDVIYCRFLLTHLENAQAAIAGWTTQLNPGGLLLMEEVEWIETDNAVFTTYLDIVAAMIAEKSGELYVGPILDAADYPEHVRRHSSAVKRLRVPTAHAAGMFHMNIQTWKNQPFVQSHYRPAEIERLEHYLKTLCEGPPDRIDIEWGLRQLALEKL